MLHSPCTYQIGEFFRNVEIRVPPPDGDETPCGKPFGDVVDPRPGDAARLVDLAGAPLADPDEGRIDPGFVLRQSKGRQVPDKTVHCCYYESYTMIKPLRVACSM
jgi:hypothetical protein